MQKITKLALLISAGLLGTNLYANPSVEFVPGKYIGEANGRNGPMKVEVTVNQNKIINIQVLSHRESAGLSDAPLTQLPNEIIDRQTLKVDNIAGATFSSQGLIKATQNALSKATKDLSPLLLTTLPAKAKKAMKDEKADIVVIGSGIAGLTAAIAAKEKGSNVLVIEKQGMLGAGDSMNISTGITAGGSKFIQEHGIKGKSTQDYVDHLMKQAKDKGIPINKANVETYARRGGEIIDWLEQLGVPFGRFQEDKHFHITKDGSAPGPHIMKALKAEVEKQGIPYRLNSKVTEILSDHGKAIGVEVSTPEGKYKVLSKAVIVATGGFSASPELLKRYAPDWIGRPTTGASSLTGDGIRMAQAIGADTASMEQIKVNYLCHPLTKKDGVSLTAITPYTVLINHDGKRFVDENHPSINCKSKAMMKQPKHEAYAVVDQKAMDNLKLMRNYAEAGYFVKADTIPELAKKLDVNQKAFIETMDAYIKDCKEGLKNDKAFGRKIQYPMLNPPYYAALVTPSMQSTYGGIKTNTKAEALDTKGHVIPGLYAAGAASGHEAYANEVGFAAIIGLTYGRIAGENAAAYAK